ncbi:MAG: GDP-mannose 4,6-dehydratase [Candidatus Sumerlaeia bacterium]|nr:GDP-mannose 4,6-dehydratase [Candidatus Sumerlaeia bacterium]
MNVLITGGAGFIGSHLAEEQLTRGRRVHVIDDLSTGRMANIVPLKTHPRFSYTIETIMNTAVMSELIDQCDVVFHLAAAVGVRLIFEQPVHTIETNIKGTEIVLERAARKGKKVFIASSSEVYGKGDKVPFSEEDDMILGPTTCPRWCYACSKAIDEYLALAYFNERGLPVVIGRLFNTVGPRQVGQYGMVIPRFIERALRNDPLVVHGDGRQTRSFCYVADTVRAISDLMDTPRAAGEVFNIGSDEEISIGDLARRVIEITESRSDIRFAPYETIYGPQFEDLRRRVPSVAKLRRYIAFGPLMGISEIIRRTADALRAELHAAPTA